MRRVVLVAAALGAFITGPAVAEDVQAIFHTSPLPCVPMSSGGMFCGHSLDLKYRAGGGDHALLKLHGFRGIELVGLPSFVREVPTTYGRLLRGAPKPGNYTVEMHRDGKRIPTLDMHMRFIPR